MCWSCFYTWYPRGKNISLKCPNCGSFHTGPDLSLLLLILGFIGIYFIIVYWYIAIPILIFFFLLSKISK